MIEPNIIFEDNHIIVVIKPQNVSVQADDSGDEDLLTAIKNYIKVRDNKPGNVYVGLVHRLDRPTGGVMVFAKTSKAAARLTKEIKDKQMSKRYFCVVNGTPQIQSDRLTTYLKKDEATNSVHIVPMLESGAKEAVLEYKVVATKDGSSLIDVDLITGRSHQIRVQMSSQLHCPLYGDYKYGDTKHKCNLALWAYQLSFVHPVSKERVKYVVAPEMVGAFKRFDTEIKRLLG